MAVNVFWEVVSPVSNLNWKRTFDSGPYYDENCDSDTEDDAGSAYIFLETFKLHNRFLNCCIEIKKRMSVFRRHVSLCNSHKGICRTTISSNHIFFRRFKTNHFLRTLSAFCRYLCNLQRSHRALAQQSSFIGQIFDSPEPHSEK